MGVFELILATILVALGVRSLVSWFGKDFEPSTVGERLVYSLHVTARVGLWFAFAGFFAGYALVDEPQRFRWYVVVVIALAGVQMLTALRLAHPPRRPEG